MRLLCSAAAIPAVWLGALVDQSVRGLIGAAFGVPLHGLAMTAARDLPQAVQGSSAQLGPGAFTLMVLTGPLALIAAASLFAVMSNALRVPGWLRGWSLVLLVVALVWIPAACAAAALKGGGGPVSELYTRLGAPLAGRWSVIALSLVMLLAASRALSRQAVHVGRAWMRADALEFRRRLVRVIAGWPAVSALAALAWWLGWAPTAWVVIFLTFAMISLQISTS